MVIPGLLNWMMLHRCSFYSCYSFLSRDREWILCLESCSVGDMFILWEDEDDWCDPLSCSQTLNQDDTEHKDTLTKLKSNLLLPLFIVTGVCLFVNVSRKEEPTHLFLYRWKSQLNSCSVHLTQMLQPLLVWCDCLMLESLKYIDCHVIDIRLHISC